MQSKRLQPIVVWLGAGVFVALMMVGVWAGPVEAGAPPPPRPTVAPIAVPPSHEPETHEGAHIQLRVSGAVHVTAWTVVQWQDSTGAWREVEGWRGTPDEWNATGGVKTWWLAEEVMGRGPFRWVVYESAGGNVVAVSAPFELPRQIGERLVVNVTVGR